MTVSMRTMLRAATLFVFLGGIMTSVIGCGSGSQPPPTLTSISVTPANPSINLGTTDAFTATGTYSNNTTQNLTTSVTWSSSSTSVATISNTSPNNGVAAAAGAGSTTITATSGSISGSTMLTVNAGTLSSIAVTPVNPTINNGSTEQFTATGTFSNNSTQNLTTNVTWSSSNTGVATISNSSPTNGIATSVTAGSTTITATDGSVSGNTLLTITSTSGATLLTLVVSPQNPVIADAGATQAFTATGYYSDGSTQNLTSSVAWSSSNSGVATVNSSGTATSQSLASGLTAGFTTIQATDGSVAGASILSVTLHTGNGFAGVFTQHSDISRTGQNVNETALTTSNVKSGTFGKLFADTVDGYIYAQPLYVPNVTISGTKHNVIYVATENDSVYAFDADTGGSALWHASLIDTAHGAASGATAASGDTPPIACEDLVPTVGTTSTPVIDPSGGTMYVEAESSEGGSIVHRLHAIDITTGNEKSQGPVIIAATVTGTGDGSSGSSLSFNPARHLNRPGLLWLNGEVYLGYASLCDTTPYHGWVFAYNAATFTQNAVFITTANGSDGGFWNSGSGLSADSNGNLFLASGNGTFDTTNVPATMLGDSIMKLNLVGSSLMLEDYFTPYNQAYLSANDEDLGSGGVLMLPAQPGSNPDELFLVSKQGTFYLVDRDQMTTGNEHYCGTCTSDPEIVEEVQYASSGLWSMPAYWNETIYMCGEVDSVQSYPLTDGLFNSNGTSSSSSPEQIGFPGATPSVSANGTTNGIVWIIDSSHYAGSEYGGPGVGPAVMHAYDATNLATELYNTTQSSSDKAGNAVKFTVPTIANGKVYIGTQTEVDVYGILP